VTRSCLASSALFFSRRGACQDPHPILAVAAGNYTSFQLSLLDRGWPPSAIACSFYYLPSSFRPGALVRGSPNAFANSPRRGLRGRGARHCSPGLHEPTGLIFQWWITSHTPATCQFFFRSLLHNPNIVGPRSFRRSPAATSSRRKALRRSRTATYCKLDKRPSRPCFPGFGGAQSAPPQSFFFFLRLRLFFYLLL